MDVTVDVVDEGRMVVAIDGISLVCASPVEGHSEWMRSMRWLGGEIALGHINGGPASTSFRDPAVIAPYVAAWRAEMDRRLAAIDAAQAAELAAYQAA